MSIQQPDVIVIGATPAGLTAATMLASQGRRVRLYDSGTTESPPVTDWLPATLTQELNALGILDQLVGAAAPGHAFGEGYPIRRGQFDLLLLDNARKHGVEVLVGMHVLHVLFDGNQAVGVSVIDTDSGSDEVMARVIIDATGPKPIVAKSLPILEKRPASNPEATWGYFTDILGMGSPGTDGAWITLLPEGQACLGFIEPDSFELAAPSQTVCERIGLLALREQQSLTKRFSTTATTQEVVVYGGQGWLALWGAYGAYEPLVLPGVGRGVFAGSRAAEAVNVALHSPAPPDFSAFGISAAGISLFDALQRGCA